tara:strand:- start:8674 stop:9726 length:1053 start_codon:yes stop_codon:yes gene_type:complete
MKIKDEKYIRGEVLFFAKTDKSAIEKNDFYIQDIRLIESLGYKVKICSRFRDLRFRKYSFIFIWWWTYAAPIIFAAKVLKIPTFITGTLNYIPNKKISSIFSSFQKKPFFLRKLILYSIFNCNKNLMVSKLEIKNLTKTYPKLKNKIIYFPHSYDSELCKFEDSTKEKNSTLNILNIAWSSKQNLKRKNIIFIIKAFHILSKKYKNIKLILLGRKGDGYDLLKKEILNLNLVKKVVLVPDATYQEKVKYMKNSNIYVQPSLYEGFGLAILEAMSIGLPVVVTDAGEIKNLVDDCGFYVDPYSIYDLVEVLDLLIRKPKLRSEYSLKSVGRSLLFSNEAKRTKFYEVLSNM